MGLHEERRGSDMMPTAAMHRPWPARPRRAHPDDLARTAYRLTADLAKPNAAIYWTDLCSAPLSGMAPSQLGTSTA